MKKALVITASDSSSSGKRADLSGPKAAEILEGFGFEIRDVLVLPDDQETLEDALRHACDVDPVDLVVTTGGTGFSKRDVTPEATLSVSERLCPGIPEAMRAFSMKITPRAMLSRAQAGIRKSTLIVNLPGSPKAVDETLSYITPSLIHGIEILTGEASNCAR